jgi:hypothetical protein
MATLTTTVTESVTLNGHTYGNSRTKTFTDVTQVVQQNVIVDEGEFLIYGEQDGDEATQAGHFDAEKVQYIRITNLSTSINLKVFVDSAEAANVDNYGNAIKPGCSMIFGTMDDGVLISDSAAVIEGNTFVDISKIAVAADSSTVEVEYFIASQSQ